VDTAAWRRETRKLSIAERLRMAPEAHQAAATAVESALAGFLLPLPPQTLGAYWPYRGEVDLGRLMQKLRDRGWITALPRVVGPHQPLEYLRWDADSEMEAGVYGIPVPRARVPVRPDVLLAPLVAFDEAKYRLGYGAGYFDATLAGLAPRPRAIGVGFELGRVHTTYPLATDIPMDLIVTEAGIA
jgi:5-formyltetrahydrofolate cyclo-ligase